MEVFFARRRVIGDRYVAKNCASSRSSAVGGGSLHAATPFAFATTVLTGAGNAGGAATDSATASSPTIRSAWCSPAITVDVSAMRNAAGAIGPGPLLRLDVAISASRTPQRDRFVGGATDLFRWKPAISPRDTVTVHLTIPAKVGPVNVYDATTRTKPQVRYAARDTRECRHGVSWHKSGGRSRSAPRPERSDATAGIVVVIRVPLGTGYWG
jgi:hypothetical protein